MQRGLILIAIIASVGCQGNLLGGGNREGLQATADGGTDYSGSGPGSVNPVTCTATASAPPLQRLNAVQYTNSVKDLLGLTTLPALALPTDDAVGPFAINTQTDVTDLTASQYQTAAETLAVLAVPSLSKSPTAGCATVAANAGCVSAFVTSFGARAFRRPLTSDEVTRYANLATPYLTAKDPNNALRIVVQGLLQSPYFLYRPEFGDAKAPATGAVPLNSYELASRLSYFLWNTTPDATLQEAAAGNLQDPNALAQQVQRMVASPRFAQSIGLFVQSLLGTATLPGTVKDPNAFPTYNAALADAMAQETVDFTNYVMQQGDGRLATLLTAPYSVLSDPLFAYYGATKPAGWTAGTVVQLNPNERAGLLTQGAFLTAQAHFSSTGVVARGKTLRENFLCQAMPPPPANVPPLPTVAAGQRTARQIFASHVSSPSCASCHDLMDPMGLAFEHYDGIGSWRDTDHGLAVDVAGTLSGTAHTNGSFVDATSLAAMLGNSQDVQLCVATQMARFSLQRQESTVDNCSIAQYARILSDAQGDMRALARDIVISPAFTNLSTP